MASPRAAQRVWPMCSGPVGFAETNSMLTVWPASAVLVPYSRPGFDDGLCQGTGGGSVHGDVQEAGTGDVHGRDAVDGLQPGAQDGGELARIGAGLLGQLQGDIGGPVAVVPVLRSLHAHLSRNS